MTPQHPRSAPRIDSAPAENLPGMLNEFERKRAPAVPYFLASKSLMRSSPRAAILGSRRGDARGPEAGGQTESRSGRAGRGDCQRSRRGY